MDNKELSLLDEIDNEYTDKIEKDEIATSKVEELKLLINKFVDYNKKLLERGIEINFNECKGLAWNDDIMINNGYSFYIVEKNHGQCNKQLIVNDVYNAYPTLKDSNDEVSIYHTEISTIIVLSIEDDNFYLYYCRDLSADISLREFRDLVFLKKPNAVNLRKNRISIVPQNINSEDIENCFKFLLNKTISISLSEEAVVKSESSGACFIATSVYGSYSAPEVVILRQFRDNQLLPHPFGRAFVNKYYKFSPSLSILLNKHKFLKKLIHTFIMKPIVYSLKWQKSNFQ